MLNHYLMNNKFSILSKLSQKEIENIFNESSKNELINLTQNSKKILIINRILLLIHFQLKYGY